MNLNELLTMRGFPKNAKIKLVRHKDTKDGANLGMLYEMGMLNDYQQRQNEKVFHGYNYVITFLGIEGTLAKFVGIYECKKSYDRKTDIIPSEEDCLPENFPYPVYQKTKYLYKLEKTNILEDLTDRLVINWGKATRSWHQRLQIDTIKEVIEILPPKGILVFPGYERVLLSFSELEQIVSGGASYRKWREMLSAVSGVYVVLDTISGKQYVGSAASTNGILGRWKEYAEGGHDGNNSQLKELLLCHPDRYKYFQFSLLRTLSKGLTRTEVVSHENHYKKILGSKVFGLNAN